MLWGLLSLDFKFGEHKQFEIKVERMKKVTVKEVVFVVFVIVVVTEFQKL